MKFRATPRDDIELNITPLIDVVFLLLIFFMVSTTFKHEFEIGLDLPQAASTTQLENSTLSLSIDAEGNYFVNEQKLVNSKVTTLKRALEKATNGNLDVPMIISADAATPHQAVISAMDAARQVGLTRLTFATKQPSNQ